MNKKKRTICKIINESITLTDDKKLLSNLMEIQERAEKMEDRLIKYCNAIESLGFSRIDRDYDMQ